MSRLVLVGVVLSFLACTTDDVQVVAAKPGESCDATAACDASGACVEGTCRDRCGAGDSCAEGLVCQGGGCVEKPPSPEWVAFDWSPCSTTVCDAAGEQTREVQCVLAGAQVADGDCVDTKPAEKQACTGIDECPCGTTACPGTCVLEASGEVVVRAPANCGSVRFSAWGGGGAGGSQVGATGGGGAFVTGRVVIAAGDRWSIAIAEGGKTDGDGGGATLIGKAGNEPLLVAAGGGGGASDGCSGCTSGGAGGAGGAETGEDGGDLSTTIAPYCTSATGGKGATRTLGGAGGAVTGITLGCAGETGTARKGGSANGGINDGACWLDRADAWHAGGGQINGGGGGGGSGWFGGGGGGHIWTYCAGGGGGGSSYGGEGLIDVAFEAGVGKSSGRAGAHGAGSGGAMGAKGADGRVVVEFVP